MKREPGLIAIIGYKVIKGGLWLIFAAALAVGIHRGISGELLGLATHLRLHARPWSLALARLIVTTATRRGLITLAVALLVDGVASLFEGWALWHGRWWGPWLVVLTTGAPLPLEVLGFVRHPHVVRALLLLVNAAIVVYLGRSALRERSNAEAVAPPGAPR